MLSHSRLIGGAGEVKPWRAGDPRHRSSGQATVAFRSPMTAWRDAWTFRIVDQDTGAAVSGVPVTVLDDGGRSAGVWVSDVDGIVRLPKHDRPRLRLRVGLRTEEVMELDARTLPDDPVPIVAPRAGGAVGAEDASLAIV